MSIILPVKIQPNASRNEIVGFEEDILKIRIKAFPDKNKANIALIRFLAKKLDLSRANIIIFKGHKTRKKLLKIDGISHENLMNKLKKF